ncbi:MAG TPA: glycosyltransferase family 2 protein [Beijerinckiaceae bacterium]|jgi:glycosyltransferase involved in cell wall biosynthesis
MLWLALLATALAALPAILAFKNLVTLRAPQGTPPQDALVSILIPARNEEANIAAAVAAARASTGVAVEILVMDDGSSDRTPEIVREIVAHDPRVRLESAPPLPEGWTGKVHACQRLAEAARGTHLLYIDADVRLEPGTAAAMAGHAARTGMSLVSAVPRQVTRSTGELLTVPMINYLLLGYLPVAMMRWRRTDPSLGAACGQLLLAEREAYFGAGGHAAIRSLLHDGIQLARRFRDRGYGTDLVAGAGLATCRMYRGFDEAWAGFLKNAHEGMAKPAALPVWTVLLFGGHVLPLLLSVAALAGAADASLAFVALGLSLGSRAAVTVATRENPLAIPLHPVATLVALAIQWTALLRTSRGGQAGWKGRLYPAA